MGPYRRPEYINEELSSRHKQCSSGPNVDSVLNSTHRI